MKIGNLNLNYFKNQSQLLLQNFHCFNKKDLISFVINDFYITISNKSAFFFIIDDYIPNIMYFSENLLSM